jgi:hypothetical protein
MKTMAGLFSNIVSVDAEIEHCTLRETEERTLAAAAADISAREAHLALAQRYADRASSLAERSIRLSAPRGFGAWRTSQQS